MQGYSGPMSFKIKNKNMERKNVSIKMYLYFSSYGIIIGIAAV